jgi:hypothetical protein
LIAGNELYLLPIDQMRKSVLTFAFILALCSPLLYVVWADFFSLDEPNMFWDIRSGLSWNSVFQKFILEGRPVYGFFTLHGVAIVNTLEHIKVLRVISITVQYAFCWQVYRFLKRHGLAETQSFVVAVFVFSLPGIALFIPWGGCWSQYFSAILAFSAGSLAVRVFSKHLGDAPLSRIRENSYLGLALVLELIALLSYQNLGLAFVLPAFFVLMLRKEVYSRKRFLFYMYSVFSFLLCLAVYYKVYTLMLTYAGLAMSDRGAICTKYLAKLSWAWTMLCEAGKFHLVLFKSWIQYIGLWALALLVLRDLYRKRFLDLFFLLSFCVLVFLPHLILAESWTASRNYALVSGVLLVYFFLRLFELISIPSRMVAAVLGIGASLLLCFTVNEGWVKPQHKDYALMHSFVSQMPGLSGKSIWVEARLPAWNLHSNQSIFKAYADEYNDPVFSRGWAVAPALKLMYNDLHPESSTAKIQKIIHVKWLKPEEAFSAEQTDSVVLKLDLNVLKQIK